MNPATCAICGQPLDDAAEGAYGDWVAFADHDNHTLPEPGSRAPGLAYFCAEHLALARERAAWRCHDAVQALRLHAGAQAASAAQVHSAPAPLAGAAEAATAPQSPWWQRWWG
ncbi:hypothetical protein AVMA1855_02135 [Acidovorax sp. SUPP1855]|uniref:hypothetical protein n=1 Tax=Acidovorax sp. SUPP1855 TaxID=431774 RepID=UPI0023DE642E|nr:hypothetical protein [Acidovorax sp. SUPP1855]GKS82901.1 hypothetical protein AVMA1855_02135 [Acidovorax sp. SUPP1855]